MLNSSLHQTPSGLSLICSVPEGITIKPSESESGQGGYGIFTRVGYKKGDIIYTGEYHSYEHSGGTTDVNVTVDTDIGVFPMTLHGHAVKTHNISATTTNWRIYTFDSFINHSCEANTTDIDSPQFSCGTGGKFSKVASADIAAGEELTSDYDLFIYSYAGIRHCQCGTRRCRGYSYGFKHYPDALRSQVLHLVDPCVLAEWYNDQSSTSTSTSTSTNTSTLPVVINN